ncbi:MAG TPA: hypothetical protein VMF91_22965 [Bryobacteraceae bacterium]|nr:hypothetical protein [Bryobacteraceae bacterium]
MPASLSPGCAVAESNYPAPWIVAPFGAAVCPQKKVPTKNAAFLTPAPLREKVKAEVDHVSGEPRKHPETVAKIRAIHIHGDMLSATTAALWRRPATPKTPRSTGAIEPTSRKNLA